MYTQCPECGTVFRLSADTLRLAQGEVRCGICSTVFNAVESLSDTPAAHLAHQAAPEDTITVEELSGSEIIELDSGSDAQRSATPARQDPDSAWPADPSVEPPAMSDADEILQDTGAAEPEASSIEVSIADDEVAAMLEASGTWERLRVAPPPAEDSSGITQAMAAAIEGTSEQITLESPQPGVEPVQLTEYPELAAPEASEASEVPDEPVEPVEPVEPAPRKHDQDPTDEFPILVLDESDVIDAEVEERVAEAERIAAQSDALLMPQAFELPPAPTPEPPISIPDDMRRPLDRSDEQAAAEAFADTTLGVMPGRERRRWPWAVAALLLLALAAQVIHHERATLARDPTFGPWLLRAYEALGLDPPAPVDLGALELRQWGAASDAIDASHLRFRASIINRATHSQPLPLLRLTVQDRFGNVVGSRDALPREYLRGTAAAATLINAGQRVDAELVIVDPGDTAVGFELQLCVPAGTGVRCANDLAGT